MTTFRTLGGAKAYRNWQLWQDGDYIQGKFTGTSTDNFGKENFHVDISETNIEFDPDHHYIPTRGKNKGKKVFDREVKVGETLSLNNAGSLAYKMGMVNEGEMIKVVYMGTDVLPEDHQYAGSIFHQVEVLVAENGGDEGGEPSDDLDSFVNL
jgi:hypothetical protein